ncbi:MAG: nucleotidyltransferase domain-containing protein [Candidatus Eremiobacterota bacterium]
MSSANVTHRMQAPSRCPGVALREFRARTENLDPVDVEALKAALEPASRSVGAIAVYLHGSHASGTARPDSDLDLAVLLPRGSDFEDASALLADAAGDATGLSPDDVDVQNLDGAPPLFKVRVYFEGIPLFVSDPTALARASAPSLSEHLDNEYYLAPFRAAMRDRIREGRFAAG